MKRSFGSLIILPPASARIHRLRYTRTVVRVLTLLGVAVLSAFFGVRHFTPPPVPDVERVRLERENQALKIEKRDLELQAKQLEFRVNKLEEISKEVTNKTAKD
jgi:hypothetical protein